jgi:hypothetical protein
MADPEEIVRELERILKEINANLKQILPTVTKDTFTDSYVRDVIQEAERLSRWKRTPLPDDGPREWSPRQGDYAITRANAKAKEYGEPFVIAEKDDGQTIVIMPKSRLLKKQPFGLTVKNVIYETDKAMA